MRVGYYELLIVDSGGNVFDEILLNGQNCIQAQPGQEFMLKLMMHPDDMGNCPAELLICQVYIDGQYIGFNQLIVENNRAAMIKGFKNESNEMQSFQFCLPRFENEISSKSHLEASIGTIKVDFYEAEQTYIPSGPNSNKSLTHSNSVLNSDDKKFWQKPSLTTIPGRILPTSFNWEAFTSKKLRPEQPDATLLLYYHTPDMIRFLDEMQLDRVKRLSSTTSSAAMPICIDLDDTDTINTDTRQTIHTTHTIHTIHTIQTNQTLHTIPVDLTLPITLPVVKVEGKNRNSDIIDVDAEVKFKRCKRVHSTYSDSVDLTK